MAEPVSFAIVEEGSVTCYQSRWLAQTMHEHIVWGPRLAEKFIRARHTIDPRQLWSETMFAAGAVLDLDRRRLTFISDDDRMMSVPYRRRFIYWMRRLWSGWQIDWAHGGVYDVVRAVGLPPEPYLDVDVSSLPAEAARSDLVSLLVCEPDESQVLLTCRTEDGVAGAMLFNGEDPIIYYGLDALRRVLSPDGYGGIQIREERLPTLWSGVHLDIPRTECFYWSVASAPDIERRVHALYPEWTFTWLQDRYEEHRRVTESFVEWPVVDDSAIDILVFESLDTAARCTHPIAVGSVQEKLELIEGLRE